MTSLDSQEVCCIRGTGNNHPAFQGRNVVREVEAKRRYISTVTNRNTEILRAKSFATVLDQDQAVILTNSVQRPQIARIAVYMHRHDALGLRAYRFLGFPHVYVQRIDIAVNNNWDKIVLNQWKDRCGPR